VSSPRSITAGSPGALGQSALPALNVSGRGHRHWHRRRRGLVAEAERSFGPTLPKVPGQHTAVLVGPDKSEPIGDFPDTNCLNQVANRHGIEDWNYNEALRSERNEWVPGNFALGNFGAGNPDCIGRNTRALAVESGLRPEGHSLPSEPEH